MRDHGLGHQEEASDVEVMDRGEVLHRALCDSFVLPYCCIVDQDIYMFSKSRSSCFDNLLGRFDLAQVGSDFDRA